MRKLRSLTGMPVVCRNRRIGRVAGAELSDDLNALNGIWVAAGLYGARFIPVDALEILGRVAVITDSPGSRARLRQKSTFYRAISTDGHRLGVVTDAEIDELSFAVTALELSRGLWDDLMDHRVSASHYRVNRNTGEVIIDLTEGAREAEQYEAWHDSGPDYRYAGRRSRSDGVWRDELADGAPVEPEGSSDWQLDL